MELYRREFLISRIRAGYIPINLNGRRIVIHSPGKDLALRGSEVFLEAYERAAEEELLDDDDIYKLLIIMDLWSEQKEKELNEVVPGHIEYWKIELYNNMLKSNTRASIRKYLDVAKKEYNKLYQLRHSFDHLTCLGYASYIKNMFLISKSARYNKKKINWASVDINQVMNLYHAECLDVDTIRTLSRTTPWANWWTNLKHNGKIFDNTYLTPDQHTIISWSTMYDKIYESPDCPPEEVVQDDDMLDGWLLIQKRKREADKKRHELESTLSDKVKNADDIFLMAETPNDARKIDLLNTEQAVRTKQQRMKEVRSHGALLEQQLSDVKLKRSMQLQQAYVNTVKGR
jgi:hypothetical protein